MQMSMSQATIAKIGAAAAVGGLAIAVVLRVPMHGPSTTMPVLHSAAPGGQTHSVAAVQVPVSNDPAERIRRRLQELGEPAPSAKTLKLAMDRRQQLLSRDIRIHIDSTDGKNPAFDGAVRPAANWFLLRTSAYQAEYVPQQGAIRDAVQAALPLADGPVVRSLHKDGKTMRADIAIAKGGFAISADDAAKAVLQAIRDGHDTVALAAASAPPTVTLETGSGRTVLTLLATGHSDFADSTPGRDWNVHKVINESLKDIYVAPGATFSFVDALNIPVTLDKGWKEDLGLFGGSAALTPGAGICQGATTTYRAILKAGFPVAEMRNHSLFVPHYEKFGVGLDATVFPGFHDMRFTNNTGHPLLLQAHTEGTEAFVNVFGVDDGRTVTFDGPYYYSSHARPAGLRALGVNEIGWTRTITDAQGKTVTQPLIAHYAKPVFRYVMKTYAEGQKGAPAAL
jgi:vancomycin resistance protein YoaR